MNSRIKTQDSIFQDFNTERLLEIGPVEALVNMAKAALAPSPYRTQDTASGTDRKLLSYRKDYDEIYYTAPADPEPQPKVIPSAKPKAIVVSEPASVAVVEVAYKTDVSIPDVPLTSMSIISCLAALVLRKFISEISPSQSIKALYGGMSCSVHSTCFR